MTKHLHSQMKSSEMMSKYNTLRAARESNQSMTSFNIHKGVHLNEYPPKQIQIHQQAFRSHRGRQTMNMSAMRVTSKNHKAQFYYCQICLQSFLAESDLKRHLLLHGANEWHNHGQNYYIFRLGNENFATSSSLNNCIDRRSDLTRLNQKLIEETTDYYMALTGPTICRDHNMALTESTIYRDYNMALRESTICTDYNMALRESTPCRRHALQRKLRHMYSNTVFTTAWKKESFP
ncbi:zinc finger protein 729 [Biomphalaria glabrata]